MACGEEDGRVHQGQRKLGGLLRWPQWLHEGIGACCVRKKRMRRLLESQRWTSEASVVLVDRRFCGSGVD